MQSNLDDLPVGGGNSEAVDVEMGAEIEPVKPNTVMNDEFPPAQTENDTDNVGPIDQRLASKNWSIRAKAFDELISQFKGASSPQDPIFHEHGPQWKKYLGDNNPGALEKCLDALNAYLNSADPKIVETYQNEIIRALIEKCNNHAKPIIKEKSMEAFNLIFEVSESFEPTIPVFEETLKSKIIKISTTAIASLNLWIANYGVKKITIKPFLPIIAELANNTNAQIRVEAMNFYKECYKWLGEALKPLSTGLKKQQLDELDKAYEDLKGQPKNIRLTRTEQEKKKAGLLPNMEDEGQGGVDVRDLSEAVDLLKTYNNEWQEKLAEMKKWNEKKELLEALYNDSNVIKIMADDFTSLIKQLKPMLTDSNAVVAQLSVKIIGNLAKGLTTDFEPYIKEIMPALLLKFREKNNQRVEEAHAVFDKFLDCTSLEFILNEVVAGIMDSSPQIKKHTCIFLEKIAQQTYIDSLQRCSQDLIISLMKGTDDQSNEVRDACLSALGILKGRLGESVMSKHLQVLNPQKLAKVNEQVVRVQPSKYDKPLPVKVEEKIVVAPPKAKPAPKQNISSPKDQPIEKVNQMEEEKQQTGKQLENQQQIQQQQNQNISEDIEMKEQENEKMMQDETQVVIPASTNAFEDQPIGGSGKGGYNLDNLDEMPISGGGNKGYSIPNDPADQPLTGGGNKGYKLDDIDMTDPKEQTQNDKNELLIIADIPKKKTKGPPARFAQKMANKQEDTKTEENDDVLVLAPPKKAPPKKQQELVEDKMVIDEQPLLTKADNVAETEPQPMEIVPSEEIPINGGGKKGYDLDNLGEMPISGGGSKGYDLNNLDDMPIGGKGGAYKIEDPADQPIGGSGGGYKFEDPADLPIGGKGGGYKFDDPADQPIGGKGGGYKFDDPTDQPIGGGGKGYNLDNLDGLDPMADPNGMNFMSDPKKKAKAPPARFANKAKQAGETAPGNDEALNEDVMINRPPVKKPPVVMDEEMKNEEVKRPPPKAKPTEKPSAKPAAAKKGADASKGGDAGDEDAGGGLSKEEADQKVRDTFNPEFVAKLEETKWQDKVEGFKGISEQVVELQPSADVIEGLAKFVKGLLKDWKESNVNLIKETINLFTVIAQNCPKVNKRAVACLMPFLSDKIGDVKVMQTTKDLLIAMAELVTPKYIGLQIIKYANKAKSPNVLKESCNILAQMTDEWSVVAMPLKDMIDYAVTMAQHSNAQVRTASMALLAMIYKHAGEAVKSFLKDIKESTMKLIDEEFAKITPLKKGEHVSKRGLRGEAAEEAVTDKKGGGDALDDALGAREDISKHINAKLIAMFKNNDWKERKKGAEKVEELCKAANMRIAPTGLTELMDNMKQRMVDPNKAVLKAYLQLIGVVVQALGAGAKQYAKKILPPILQNLADKQSLVRNDTLAVMNIWSEQVAPEVVINHLVPLLVQENPELRTEALTWVIKNKDSLKVSEIKETVKPLVSCLCDKAPSVRGMAEQIVCDVMPLVGAQAFASAVTDLKPAVQQTIKGILEKVKSKVGPCNAPLDANNGSLGAPPQQQQQQQQQPTQPTLKPHVQQQIAANNNKNLKEDAKNSSLKTDKPTIKSSIAASSSNNASLKEEAQTQQQQAAPQQRALGSTGDSRLQKKLNQTPSQINKQSQRSGSRDSLQMKSQLASHTEESNHNQPEERIHVVPGLREKRAEYDKKNKWHVDEIKADSVDKLKQWAQQSLGPNIQSKMFSNDFNKHCECINIFQGFIETQPEELIEILDLVFKWALIRLQDSSNTKFAINIFDFFGTLFQHLEEIQYMLLDFEANVILPLLCEKAGLNNAILKDKVKKLIKLTYNVYDKQKCYQTLISYGLNSKNLRTVAECLDEIAEFLNAFGIDYSQDKDLRIIAKLADSNDKAVRENSLKAMGEAYKLLDDGIWTYISNAVTPKVQSLIEQRFKKIKGLGGSSSSSNLQFHNQGSPSSSISNVARTTATGGSFGLKKPISALAQQQQDSKKTITPRNGLQFKGVNQSQLGQSKLDSSASNLMSRSIKNFNSSLKSNEGAADSRPKITQSTSGLPKKTELKKSDNHNMSGFGAASKKLIPQTQRLEQSHSDLKNSFGPGFKQSIGGGAVVEKKSSIYISNDDEDDEDLRMLATEGNFGDPELDSQKEEITKYIYQLKYGDLSKRVDALVSLNDMICNIDQNKLALIKTSNDLVNAFTHVLIDIFDRSVEDIPLRFAKYFITIVHKACSCKEIMKEVSEDRIHELAEQLLTRLLIENLDKVGENKEGELILKNLNSSMLRLLENCNHTYIFCVLFNLLRKYKDFHKLPKLPGLIIKCLLKLSKILEKLIDQLDMEKILLAIHEYLVVVNHDNKTQNDEMGIRIVKTVVNELVKLKREKIWDAYSVIQCHNQQDNHIYRWINIILKSLQSQGGAGSTLSGGPGSTTGPPSYNVDSEIKHIVEELKVSDQFEAAIPKLHKFLQNNPQVELSDHLQECSKQFQHFIITNLEKYRNSQNKHEENKAATQFNMMGDSMKSTSHSDSISQPQENDRSSHVSSTSTQQQQQQPSRINNYQNKLQTIQQRYTNKSGAATGSNREQTSSQQNLNTSFSAMNSSLSHKWNQMQKSSATKRESGAGQMSSTMGGFGGGSSSNLETKIGKGGATGSNLNQSIGASSSGEQQPAGATNSDLNRRLAEMKAKLQALKRR